MSEQRSLHFWQVAFFINTFFLILAIGLLLYTKEVFVETARDAIKCFQDQRQLMAESRNTEREHNVCLDQLRVCQRSLPSPTSSLIFYSISSLHGICRAFFFIRVYLAYSEPL